VIKIGFKIREAQLEKVPYMIVVGQKEAESHMLSVRDRDHGDKGVISFNDFMNMKEII